MGSFPLTKSSYLILEAWNAAISFCGLQFFPRENIVFPFFCWVAQTARLYLTDMGSMCAPFPELHKRNINPCPGTSCSSKDKLDGRRLTLQGLGMGPLLGLLICGSLCTEYPHISLGRCCLSDWLCSDHFSNVVKILKQGGKLPAHKEIGLATWLPLS